MMGILDTLTLKRTTAFDTVIQIAKREAQGNGKPNDADQLENALTAAKLGEKDYADILKSYRDIEVLKVAAGKLPAAEKSVGDAHEAERAFREETERLIKQRKLQLAELRQGTVRAQAAFKTAEKARAELEVLELEQPQLFGGKSIDLDAFTLTWGENTITRAAPDAPTRAVAQDVWERENRRRNEIHEAAKKQAHAEWQDELARWNASRQRNVLGEFLPGAAPAEFKVPDWGAIVARGWNTALDEPEIA